MCLKNFFFKKIFVRDRGRNRQRENSLSAGSMMRDSIPGSCPEPKVDTKPLSHPEIPKGAFLKSKWRNEKKKSKRKTLRRKVKKDLSLHQKLP